LRCGRQPARTGKIVSQLCYVLLSLGISIPDTRYELVYRIGKVVAGRREDFVVAILSAAPRDKCFDLRINVRVGVGCWYGREKEAEGKNRNGKPHGANRWVIGRHL
jgi:hypothetical protein